MQIDINLTTKTMFKYQHFREELNSLKHLSLGLISPLNFGISEFLIAFHFPPCPLYLFTLVNVLQKSY